MKNLILTWAGTIALAFAGSYVGQMQGFAEHSQKINLIEKRLDALDIQIKEMNIMQNDLTRVRNDVDWIKRYLQDSQFRR